LSEWLSDALLNVLSLVLDFRGRTPKKLGMEWGGGDIPALSANNVEMGQINFAKECYFASDALYKKWMTRGNAQIGDVVLTTEAPLGNVAQILDSQRYILSQRAILLRADEAKLSNDYLAHYLRSDCFQNLMRQQSSGTTATGIQRKKLETLPIRFPYSRFEQSKIAEVISIVDRAVQQTEALIAKQRRINTGLMQDLLTRGIDEHGHVRSESTHHFKDTSIGRIPAEWEPTSLDSISALVTSGSRGWAKYYSTEGAIFLRIGNLTRDHINLRLDDLVYVDPPESSEGKRAAVQSGDVLISITADLGIIGVIPAGFGQAFVNQHIALVRCKTDILSPRFAGWFLTSLAGQRQFEALNESGAKAGLNLPTIRQLKVPVPDKSEQDRIASALDRITISIESTSWLSDKLRFLKSGLMQDLLTGRMQVAPLLEAELTH
jgi:type I restriction enzyme S subunit